MFSFSVGKNCTASDHERSQPAAMRRDTAAAATGQQTRTSHERRLRQVVFTSRETLAMSDQRTKSLGKSTVASRGAPPRRRRTTERLTVANRPVKGRRQCLASYLTSRVLCRSPLCCARTTVSMYCRVRQPTIYFARSLTTKQNLQNSTHRSRTETSHHLEGRILS